MKIKLFLPQLENENMSFSYGKDISSEEYVNMIEKTEQEGEAVYDIMSKGLENNKKNASFYTSADGKEYEDNERYTYSSAECDVLNIMKKDMPFSELKQYESNSSQFVFIAQFNPDKMEEDFETEIKMLRFTHEKIEKYEDKDEKWKLMSEPTRNFKFEIDYGNETYKGKLSNCKMIDSYNSYIYAFLCEKIIFEN